MVQIVIQQIIVDLQRALVKQIMKNAFYSLLAFEKEDSHTMLIPQVNFSLVFILR